jgi:hypothetical protein
MTVFEACLIEQKGRQDICNIVSTMPDKARLTCFYFGLTAAALLPLAGKSLTIAGVDAHKGVTPRIAAPTERGLDRSARHPSPIEQIQGSSHN